MTVASSGVRRDAGRGDPAGALDRLRKYWGFLLVLEDERVDIVPAGCCIEEGRLRDTVEIGEQRSGFEASRIGFSGTQVVYVPVGDSTARGQGSLFRQLTKLAGSR